MSVRIATSLQAEFEPRTCRIWISYPLIAASDKIVQSGLLAELNAFFPLMEMISFTLRPLDLRRTPLDRWLCVPSAHSDVLAKRNTCLCRELRYESLYTATPSVPLGYVGGKNGEYYGNCSETLIKFQRRLHRSKNNTHNRPIEWERTALQHALSVIVYHQITCRWSVTGKHLEISLERQPLLKKKPALFSGYTEISSQFDTSLYQLRYSFWFWEDRNTWFWWGNVK